jgi:hypothetical protein
VDVEVERRGMVRREGERLFEGRDDLAAMALRDEAARLPVVPGLEVHQRVGLEHEDLGIVGPARGDLGDGPGPGGV